MQKSNAIGGLEGDKFHLVLVAQQGTTEFVGEGDIETDVSPGLVDITKWRFVAKYADDEFAPRAEGVERVRRFLGAAKVKQQKYRGDERE